MPHSHIKRPCLAAHLTGEQHDRCLLFTLAHFPIRLQPGDFHLHLVIINQRFAAVSLMDGRHPTGWPIKLAKAAISLHLALSPADNLHV